MDELAYELGVSADRARRAARVVPTALAMTLLLEDRETLVKLLRGVDELAYRAYEEGIETGRAGG
jgi:hypothetical protein